MKIVALSDTHCQHDKLVVPEGDLLLHAGDATYMGTLREMSDFARWFAYQPHANKVYVPGNHDWMMQRKPEEGRKLFESLGVTVLIDQEITIEGIRLYGSPHQPTFCDWAFNLPRNGPELKAKWDMIPEGLDVLITHGPPHKILDTEPGCFQPNGDTNIGDELLTAKLAKMRHPPRMHVMGHIHGGHGQKHTDETKSFNVAICDPSYNPINPITVIDYDNSGC